MNYCLSKLGAGAHHAVLGIPRGFFYQILILLAVAGIVYWIFKNNKRHETATEILRKRYVKGEISKKEFFKIKEDLK